MKRVLILGGGFGGLATAHRLKQKLAPEDEVILVDRRDYFMVGFRKTWALIGESPLEAGQRSLDSLTSLGAAGLMGAMWLWERRNSQKRDEQLDDAHTRILGDRVQLDQLIEVVRTNAEAITRLCATQDQLVRELARNERSNS